MKKIVFLFICFLSMYSVAQTLQTDDKGVRIFYEIQQTNKFTVCQGNFTSDKNYSTKKIRIWKVTIGIENGSSEAIVPRGVGIANISVNPKPLKPYSKNYCKYKHLKNYNPDTGYLEQSLFVWPIRDHMVKEIKQGETITNTTYLYLYEGQTPTLTNWQFLGYRLKKDFKPYDPILTDIEAVVNEPKAAVLIETKVKEKATTLNVNYNDKMNDVAIANVNVDEIYLTTIKTTPPNVTTDKEIKTINENGSKNDGDIIAVKKIKATKDDKNKTDRNSVIANEIEVINDIESKVKNIPIKCPGKKALEFKEKFISSSDQSEQRAYSWLVLYYTYKCECEMGSQRSDLLVPMINNVVDSYFTNTNNAYGKISKVTKCTAPVKNQ